MRAKLRSVLRGLAFAAAAIGAPNVSLAQQSEPLFRGKTVTIIIGYSVGGSDDLWARLVSRHMGRFLPGNPNVVPQNMPGAGSLVAANQIYNTAPKDGTIIGLVNRGVPFEPPERTTGRTSFLRFSAWRSPRFSARRWPGAAAEPARRGALS